MYGVFIYPLVTRSTLAATDHTQAPQLQRMVQKMAERSYPMPEARSGQEEQPHVQGVVAAQAQEG